MRTAIAKQPRSEAQPENQKGAADRNYTREVANVGYIGMGLAGLTGAFGTALFFSGANWRADVNQTRAEWVEAQKQHAAVVKDPAGTKDQLSRASIRVDDLGRKLDAKESDGLIVAGPEGTLLLAMTYLVVKCARGLFRASKESETAIPNADG